MSRDESKCGKEPLARSHADALHRLEQLAFGLDARGNDDFSLLKLPNRSRTDVAHAGRDCTDEILRAIVDRCGSEKYLAQGASDAHFNARTARKVCMRGCHAP